MLGDIHHVKQLLILTIINMKRGYLSLFMCLLLAWNNSYGQKGDRAFNDSIIHTIELNFYNIYDQSNGYRWRDTLREQYQYNSWTAGPNDSKKYLPVQFIFDGQVLDSVGIRYRGVASYGGHIEKAPMKFDFNKFKKGQTFNGLKKLNTTNERGDPTFVMNKVSYDLFNWIDIPAPRSSFAKLYVNGEYRGIHTLVEQISGQLLGMHFENKDGNLYKADFCNWDINEDNWDDGWSGQKWYQRRLIPKTNESIVDHKDVLKIYDAFSSVVAGQGDSLRKYFDIYHYVRHAAAEFCLAAFDNYFVGSGANIYYYVNPVDGKLITIPYDMNLSFDYLKYNIKGGGFTQDAPTLFNLNPQDKTVNYNGTMIPSYIYRRIINAEGLMNDPENRDKFLDEVCHIVNEYYDGGHFTKNLDRQFDLIKNEAFNDPWSLYTQADIQEGLSLIKLTIDSVTYYVKNELKEIGYTCPAYVAPVTISSGFTDLYINVGEEYFYNMSFTPANVTYGSLDWKIEDKDIASTKFFERIYGKSPGTTVVTITSVEDTSIKHIFNVHVMDPFMDDDGDGVANVWDQCHGYDDKIDVNNNGVPDACEALTGIEQIEGLDLMLSPNPSSDHVVLKYEKETPLELIIYNVSGKLKYYDGAVSPGQVIDIQQLPKGVYLFQFIDKENGFKTVEKVVKM